MEWFLDNSSNIDAIISIIATMVSGAIFMVSLVISCLRLKLKCYQYKYLNLVVDSQTKQSMKYYVSTRAQYIDPCDEENNVLSAFELIPHFIKVIFKKSEEQYFIILADSGMGKTTFLLKLFFKYYKKILRKYDIVFVPLSLNSSIEKIREVKNKSNTILLLDGFDEDQYAMEDYDNRLKDICNETELFYKVIMTCRTQFFPDSYSEPKYADNKIKFGVGKKAIELKKYYIVPFNDKEIDIYLKKKYNRIFEKDKIKRSKKLIKNCPQLMVRPMLLSYLDDLLIDNTKSYVYAYEIYTELVSKWIERETVENKTLFVFSEKVAEHMYSKKTVYIAKNEIEKLCTEYNIQISSIEAKSRSLLNRNANGSYKFAHKSILEFFLAKKAFYDVIFRKDITINGFIGYDMVKFFLREMHVSYIKTSITDQSLGLSGFFMEYFQLYNVEFSLLLDMQRADLKGANLRNANLEDANLENANLEDADLDSANLEDANLMNANLKNANLAGANLRNANLSRAHLGNVNLYEAHLTSAIFDEKQVQYLEQQYNLKCPTLSRQFFG